MKRNVLDRFRDSLDRQKSRLTELFGSEGRLMRMVAGADSRNGECDLAACEETIHSRLSVIDGAMHRVEDGSFGKCEVCGEDVDLELLELDFTSCVCLDHYSEDQKRELERDLELAAKVQQHLFPRRTPVVPGMQISVSAEPARIVGGDYFDFFRFRDTQQGLAMADVMGKGVSASMLMANLQASLRILGPENDELDELAVRLNELFRYNLKLIRFISLFLGGIDMKNRQLYYCNAGHNPPLWWSNRTGTVEWLKPTGPAIGVVPEPRFTSERVTYGTGDVFLLYTDGLIEARNGAREEYGTGRLADYTRDHADLPADLFLSGLRQEVLDFAGQLQDDTTVMVLKAS